LRLTLAALGVGSGAVLAAGPSKVTLSPEQEVQISEWISTNIDVSWVEAADPDRIEREVVATLQPPLNLEFNSGHPAYAQVKTARAELRLRSGS